MSDLIQSRADFFVTGDEYIRESLDLHFLPLANLCSNGIGGGVILARDKQDLRQSYQVARDFLERTEPGAIKFVLIGLSSTQAVEEKALDDYFKLCLDCSAKPVVFVLPVKQSLRKTYKADAVKLFRDTINKVVKKYKATFIDLLDVKLSDKLFQDKTNLNADGKAAVSALLSERLYLKNVVSVKDIYDLGEDFFGVLKKNFPADYQTLTYHTFCRIAADDFKRLSEIMPQDECKDLMASIFAEMTYDHLLKLAGMLPKDDYNDLATRVFKISAEKIRRKDKIKVGFVLYDSSTWCGNDLYNFFAQDERFEPTVFLCLRIDFAKKNAVIQKEFLHQTKQFKSSGLNVVALDNKDSAIPEQDLIIYLIPYIQRLPKAFQLKNITPKTLLAYIPYAIDTGKYDATFATIVSVAWKQFLPSSLTLEMYNKKAVIGTPQQRIYSGYPKMDAFFQKDVKLKFDWKMTRPDSKKIIWAPHHSVKNISINTGTFQWNYKFMYEFAKAHPEISWIVKPHSNLPFRVIQVKIFPDVATYEEYLNKWNELPNAKVVTGAYYQSIFATSDGIIHDCGSFTAEYQYVDKPMIYLTRKDTENNHNELGNEILKASYLVDGKDFDGIAAMIQRVIIDGDDYKASERREVFDKYLNYPKANGMLASKFIYKNIANELLYAEKLRADLFVTGNEYIRESLDLKFIPRVSFGLISLSLSQAVAEKDLDNYFKLCSNNAAKPVVGVLPVKQSLRKSYNADAVKTFRDTINKTVKKYKATFIDLLDVKLSDKLFQDGMHLNADGKAAVSALLSERLYLKNVVSVKDIYDLGDDFFGVLKKNFPADYQTLTYHNFCRIAADDFKRLSETMPQDECKDLMASVLAEMTYDHLVKLSDMLSKDDYNDLVARIFEISVKKIRCKDKIKVGFVLIDSAQWCGDELYNFFAADKRFDVTIFDCLRLDKANNEIIVKDFWRGFEQFKCHGLNVVALDKRNVDVPTQDVLIFLTPYFSMVPNAFRTENLVVKTLMTHIIYSFAVSIRSNFFYNRPMFRSAWKIFFPSTINLEMYGKRNVVGMPRGLYSGYPRMDIFFKKDTEFNFDWKMTRPDAKKIIYAPHWSINDVTKWATFQWNCQFMYEFAKTHPEISWIVKPHQALFFSAVKEKVFPSIEAFQDYLQAWNDLPNAQVYTGAYYQALFATSDAMIHDCGSFTAEYQYVDKPMIYLTRKGTEYNELGNEILKVSYLVDGQDFDGIAATIQRVIIDGDDYKASERREVFDKYLNYPKANGMLASEFIFKNIADEFRPPTF